MGRITHILSSGDQVNVLHYGVGPCTEDVSYCCIFHVGFIDCCFQPVLSYFPCRSTWSLLWRMQTKHRIDSDFFPPPSEKGHPATSAPLVLIDTN